MEITKAVHPITPPIVMKILNTNARVLIVSAPLKSLFFLLVRQRSEKIKGKIPNKPPPQKRLIIDHVK